MKSKLDTKSKRIIRRKRPTVKLGYYHISRFVWSITRDLNKEVQRVKSIKNLETILNRSPMLTHVALYNLNEAIYLLEPMMDCYLEDRGKESSYYTNGDGSLFEELTEVRRYIQKFSPKVESFFNGYFKYHEKILSKSPICEICKKRGANYRFANVQIHSTCLKTVDAKCCEYCATLYLNGEEKCEVKPECKNYQLKKESGGESNSYLSMKISVEDINKIKNQIGDGQNLYKGGKDNER